MATSAQLGLTDAASPVMEEMIYFHDHVMLVLVLITCLIFYAMMVLMTSTYIYRFLTDGHLIETVWTIVPAMILVVVALPSLKLLYLSDELDTPQLTVKTVGHQWYWSYEYTDYYDIEFDSYMLPTTDIADGAARLLEVDNRVVLPVHTSIRMLVTAADVLHSWTIPALGLKMDAVPGRLNQLALQCSRVGTFYGQCSEICGANHSFMPIVIEAVPVEVFETWCDTMLDEE
uniref:Cytochrome c oxidase subunit 2 n=1 Tax=Asymmetron sp. A TK-2007 TaxID=426588 RepID=A7X7E0_9BRAN|nr:cytochrome c oxidase subunit II [Asymmetron sp. A TK-2007]BAF76613.1 cytochrome c oxidase subunit 2 [Asymmetron sp. A TK-2007]